MNKLKHGLIALMVLALSSLVYAEPSSPKIGVLDMQEVWAKAPQVSESKIKLEKEFQSRNNDLMNKQKAIQAKHEAFHRDREVLGDSERLKREREISNLQHDFQRLSEETQTDYRIRQEEEMKAFQDVLLSAVESIGKKGKYDLILPNQTTLFNANSVNVTEQVIEKLKQQNA